jgi:hypothetical protein
MWLSFDERREAVESSRCLFYLEGSSRFIHPRLWNAWNYANYRLTGVNNMLHQTKVTLERTLLDSDPLHWLNRVFFHLGTGLHYVSHL